MATMATDVITLITKDHRTVESLFERLKAGQGDQKTLVTELHALLIAHARAEEDRVYPGIDAHHGLEEHKETEVLLDALVRAEPGTPEFRTTLDKLVESVNHHVEEEESKILPALAKSVGDKGLQELGKAFQERRAEELKALGVPKQAAPAGSGEGASKSELYEQAKKADIPGRSQMDKEELAQALSKAKS
ncbi:hemerythrin domain-containing protein [Nonomuraea angiospora]|uniref:Hemerythrin superfamily protein n=1 Tax=Nonomuraea angiospora TaxID=46172 RepID=A0ABR9LZD3_9ACTN|nr:hemerythrin domain-containing protein [Nonomuraea angiospora]MBE1585991.1 hemerythrin superfamily protein [Nonomuraea angiospora]MDX3102180.1 hemerythrin domain-containing protein [Nonomuraea angiospora]